MHAWPVAGPPRAIVQVAHGAAEHGARYARFAGALNAAGFSAFAMDHRGHGHTRVRSRALGDGGPDAWNGMVEDEIDLAVRLRAEHPGVPLVLFGHSLGSFMAQDVIARRGELLAGVVFSGTAWRPPPAAELLAGLDDLAQRDPLGPSAIWSSRFADYNRPFGGPTGFEWLSRDTAEVRRYVDDPLCGFAFSNELVRDIFRGFAAIREPSAEQRVPRRLPILIVQGEEDPIGGERLEGTRALVERYRALGIGPVDARFYPGARHELLNETNRDEVTRDVIAWLSGLLRGR